MNIKKDIRFRVYIAFTCICAFGIAIVVKAAYIQVKEGTELKEVAREMHTHTATLPAERGNIYTEKGSLLCSSIPQFDIHVDFSVISPKLFNENIDSLSECMSHLFKDESPEAYKQELTAAYKNQDRYYELKKNLPYYEYEAVRSFPIFNKGKGYGGFIEDPEEKRVNPYGMLAYRTIGLWRENSKTIGLEATYDSVLDGVSGTRLEQKSTGGTWIPIEGSEIDPQNGKDIVTTLDISIQDVAEHALMSILQRYECEYGTCIVMEVKTGKIRALVNLGRQKDGSYWEDLNYAMMPTEPGSTFKVATLLSLLNDKYVTVDDMVDAEGGAIRFGNRTMRDSHLGLHVIPIWKAYAESSNASMAKLAYTYYYKQPEKFVDHLKQLHLNVRTGIDLAGERRPLVKTPESKSWSATTLPWMATGYEVLITPLHTCMLYNAVANGGRMMKPYLISSIREYGKDVKEFKPTMVEKIADSSVIAQLRRCMRAVVTEGTAKSIESPYYSISGKTGTAQVADKGIKYTDGVYQGSFVGFFPSEHPEYTICTVIRTKPHSSAYYGGTIAAPVFRMIADKIFASSMGSWNNQLDSIAEKSEDKMTAKAATAQSYEILMSTLGRHAAIPGLRSNQMVQLFDDTLRRSITIQPKPLYTGVMPDVTGMGLKDAVYLLEREGLKVEVLGKGRVQGQSVQAGEKITRGQSIQIQLS